MEQKPAKMRSWARDNTPQKDRFYKPNPYEYHVGFEIWHKSHGSCRDARDFPVDEYTPSYFASSGPDRRWYFFIKKLSMATHPKLDGMLGSLHAFHSDDLVKYLDKEDIESLMWTFKGSNGIREFYEMEMTDEKLKGLAWEYPGTPGYKIYRYHLIHDYEQKYVQIEAEFGGERTTLFEGYVRNRSELFKLMPMLNIDVTTLKEWYDFMPFEDYDNKPE